MKGLASHTRAIFDSVSMLDCLTPFHLVGGTALSLQIGTRQSEDLDFMKWRQSKDEKMEVVLRRSKFRDYYDIYSILKSGKANIRELMACALEYSDHRLKYKNLFAMLTNGTRFDKDSGFMQLKPVYDVTAKEIEEYIKVCIMEAGLT